MAKRGLAVSVAIGKPKPGENLDSPSDLGAPPPSKRMPTAAPAMNGDGEPELGGDEDEDQQLPSGQEGGGDVTLSLSQEQASALQDVLQQIQDALGSPDDGMGPDQGQPQLPLGRPAGPMGPPRGGYGS